MLIFFGSFHRHDFILLEKRLFVVVTRRPSARSGKWLEFATLDGKLTRIPATSSALEPKICSSCVGMTQLLCEGVWTRPGNRRAQLFSVVLPIYVFIFFHRCFIIEFLHGCSNGSTFFTAAECWIHRLKNHRLTWHYNFDTSTLRCEVRIRVEQQPSSQPSFWSGVRGFNKIRNPRNWKLKLKQAKPRQNCTPPAKQVTHPTRPLQDMGAELVSIGTLSEQIFVGMPR